MRINRSLSAVLCRVSALALFATSSSIVLSAQQAAAPQTTLAELHQPLFFNGSSSSSSSLNLSENSGVGYSSSVGDSSTVSPDDLTFGDSMQPPPRRRYGRPNYSDRTHNPDGSSKITVLAGGGFVNPVGNSTTYLNIGWKAQVGVGYNFNKKAGVVFQFDYDHFGVPGSVLTNQLNVYTNYFQSSAGLSGLDANTHDWSFTLNPTYAFYDGDSKGAYVVGGVGFYHKVTNFTLPQTGQYCDYYYGCYQYTANQTFDMYTSNAAGLNGGIGFTWRPSRFASQKFYAEARVVHTFNQARAFNQATTVLYPGNSQPTTYIPVTVGVRF